MSRELIGEDRIDARRAQWHREMPDCDTAGMAVLGRARLLTLSVRPAIESVFARHGLDTGEFDVIATLLRAGPPYRLRPTELYTSLMISSGGLTDRLTRLTKAGLIVRKPAKDDGRLLLVELTAAGRRKAAAAFREDMAAEADSLSGLTAQEQTMLATLLRKLLLSLDKPSA